MQKPHESLETIETRNPETMGDKTQPKTKLFAPQRQLRHGERGNKQPLFGPLISVAIRNPVISTATSAFQDFCFGFVLNFVLSVAAHSVITLVHGDARPIY